MALRTQQVLAHESGLAEVIDPLGGAPYVEELTDEVERRALELMQTIEERGGAVAATESGFVQREILRSALEWQRAVESGERTIIGVNRFEVDEHCEVDEDGPAVFRPAASAREEVLAELARVRAERNGERVQACLTELGERARTGGNLLDPMLAAVEAYATIGEVCDVLEREFGTYQPPETL